MAEFTLHVRSDVDRADTEDGERIPGPQVKAHETVSYCADRVEAGAPGTVISDPSLLPVEDTDTLATVSTDLRTDPAVDDGQPVTVDGKRGTRPKRVGPPYLFAAVSEPFDIEG